MDDMINNAGSMKLHLENLEMGELNVGVLDVEFQITETDGTVQVETDLLGRLVETIVDRFGDSINELMRTKAAALRAYSEQHRPETTRRKKA